MSLQCGISIQQPMAPWADTTTECVSPQCGISIQQPMAPWADTLPLNYVTQCGISIQQPMAPWAGTLTPSVCLNNVGYRSNNPWHHEQTLYHWIMLHNVGYRSSNPWHREQTLYHRVMSQQCGISIQQPMAPWADTLPLNYVYTMWDINPATHGTVSRHSTTELCLHNVGYRSNNPWHHEQTLYHRVIFTQCGISIQQPMAPWADTLTLSYVYTMWDIDPATHSTMSTLPLNYVLLQQLDRGTSTTVSQND